MQKYSGVVFSLLVQPAGTVMAGGALFEGGLFHAAALGGVGTAQVETAAGGNAGSVPDIALEALAGVLS